MTQIISTIESIREQSAAAWETAVETAGPEYDGGNEERAKAMRDLADECDRSYEATIETLRNQHANWPQEARGHLLDAKQLEDEGGDSSHAASALEALAEYIADDGEMVTIETMPDHLRDSHRAAGNWGVYPINGAIRERMSREDAEELVESDTDGYTRIV